MLLNVIVFSQLFSIYINIYFYWITQKMSFADRFAKVADEQH